MTIKIDRYFELQFEIVISGRWKTILSYSSLMDPDWMLHLLFIQVHSEFTRLVFLNVWIINLNSPTKLLHCPDREKERERALLPYDACPSMDTDFNGQLLNTRCPGLWQALSWSFSLSLSLSTPHCVKSPLKFWLWWMFCSSRPIYCIVNPQLGFMLALWKDGCASAINTE
jgi:hypothetical protein